MGMSLGGQKIIPAPFIDFRKSYNLSADGTQLGATYNITLQGTILPYKGSPTSAGAFWSASGDPSDESLNTDEYLQALIKKKEALRRLFSWEGSGFRVDGFDGYSYMTANPRIKSLTFPAGNPTSWASQMKYTVEMEADCIYLYGGNGLVEDRGNVSGFKIETAEESWNIEPVDEDVETFRLSHQVSAKGKKFYDQNGQLVQLPAFNARDYVVSKLGLNQDRLYCSGVLSLTGASGYNYVRSQRQDDLGGTFSVTETWMVFTPTAPGGWHAYETFDVNTRSDEAGFTNVTIQGRIQGFSVRNNQTHGVTESTKYYNASGKYTSVSSSFHSRAQAYSQVTLNSNPITSNVGRNPTTGNINYTVEYNNRPTATISGAKSEKISVNYISQNDIFAELAVLGRAAGPVIQSIGTKTSAKKTVSIEAVMGAKTQSTTPTKPDTNSLASGYVPSATWVYKNQDQESWDEATGRYSKVVSWVYGN